MKIQRMGSQIICSIVLNAKVKTILTKWSKLSSKYIEGSKIFLIYSYLSYLLIRESQTTALILGKCQN